MIRILLWGVLLFAFAQCADGEAPEQHSHPAPEQLGKVIFKTTCARAVEAPFERALALLHSFAYTEAERAFRSVVARDPDCAIAHWGIAMSLYHQLWDAPPPADLREGARQIKLALASHSASMRERRFVLALQKYYDDADSKSAAERAQLYTAAMSDMAAANPDDAETQIFYALALIATAPPADKTHSNQKRAIAILEPIYKEQPQHPGLAHYLIHACDSAELAAHGLAAARAYSKIAPSAPHALHMPSHIFTRLGMWDESIASNLAARAAAYAQGDVGEELHAMDYLTYAYLQRGRSDNAQRLVDEMRAMPNLSAANQFKIGYAATAMPLRVTVEQKDWVRALTLKPLPHSAPHVMAIVYWARAVAAARSGQTRLAEAELEKLDSCLRDTHAAGNAYWTRQVEILRREAQAWSQAARGDVAAALQSLRDAADAEDAVEKLPVTPGPVVPAREQLGELLLEQKQFDAALREFRASLALAPRRRGALQGALAAAGQLGDDASVQQLRTQLSRESAD